LNNVKVQEEIDTIAVGTVMFRQIWDNCCFLTLNLNCSHKSGKTSFLGLKMWLQACNLHFIKKIFRLKLTLQWLLFIIITHFAVKLLWKVQGHYKWLCIITCQLWQIGKWNLIFVLVAKNPWTYCSMFSPHYLRKIKLSQI
jgi:hypothetical protein